MDYPIEQRNIGAPVMNLSGVCYIAAHDTANDSSNIDGEISYMSRNINNAFVTDFVGNGRIVQIAPHGKVSWGAGPQANPYCWAQVELVHAHSQAEFDRDYAMYVWYLRYLAEQAGLPKQLNQGNGIVTHHWISNNLGGSDHADPDSYLAKWGVSMEKFANDIANGINAAPVSEWPHGGISEEVATITHPLGWGLQAWDVNGQAIEGLFYPNGSSWKVNNSGDVQEVDGKKLLSIGPNIYIDRQYTNIDDQVIWINYVEGGAVAVWTDQDQDTGQRLPTGSAWATHGKRWSDAQNDWMYNVGTNQWVRKRFTQFGNGIE